jgi:hypothetical protein
VGKRVVAIAAPVPARDRPGGHSGAMSGGGCFRA